MSEQVGYDEFLAAFGVNSSEPQAQPETVEPPQETSEPSTLQEPAQEQPEVTPPPKEESVNLPQDKSSQAFAQMRTENKKYQGVLKNMAEVLGIQDTKNPDNMLASLQELVIKAQAQKQGVPPEVLQRLHTLEQRDQEYTQSQIRQAAYLGFQKVKDSFNLSDSDLGAFADTLVASGVNPFEQAVDLVAEYKLRNFERLVAVAEERGAQREAERAAKASNHGTVPGKKQGQSSADAEKITTVGELSNWFARQK